MAYIINHYSSSVPNVNPIITTVQDGTVDNTLDIKLIGKDVPNYGEIQNENFVFLLENFAGNGVPPRPIRGQLWFNTGSKSLRVYDGDGWKDVGGVTPANTAPANSTDGSLWYNTTTKQLFVWDGNNSKYVVIGPHLVPGKGTTRFESKSISEAGSNSSHAAIVGFANGTPITILSNDRFDLATNEVELGGNFSSLRPGINLADTNSAGVSTTYKFWGTASDSDMLGGKPASNYLLSDNLSFGNEGFTIGGLRIYIDATTSRPTIQNVTGDSIVFRTTTNSVSNTPLILSGNSILPGLNNDSNIGSAVAKFNTVYATAFDGTATTASTLKLNQVSYAPSVRPTADTVAVRSNDGNIEANLFVGVATSARFADLAEKYLTDQEYPTGTVMMIGGDAEVTASIPDNRAIGVISEYPGYMMNCDLDGGQYVALKGRVPVKVIGPVEKGDELVAHFNGCAIVGTAKVFAIALQDNTNEGVKLVEALIL
jgi:hypothetical protein